MTSTNALLPRRAGAGRLGWILSITAVVAASMWAATTKAHLNEPIHHASPVSVERIDGSDFARVTVSALGARRIGLDVVEVASAGPGSGRVSVPEQAIVWGADGTTWLYTVVEGPLTFVRRAVVVDTASGGRATLSEGPAPGTPIVAAGSAELYGAEFEVGH